MKKKIISVIITCCLIISLIPSVALAGSESKTEFVAIDRQYIKSVDDDNLTITLKKRAPEPQKTDIISLENGYPIVLAEKITEGNSVKYVAIKETETITCLGKNVSIYSNFREFPEKNFNMYNEGNDAFSVYLFNIFAKKVGLYTLEHNNQKIQIEIKLPDYGYYSKPEATTDNQNFGVMRYDAKKENVIYMIATNPEQYQHIEFYAHTEEMAGAVTLEQMGEYGEICKVTVNAPIDSVIIHCKRQFKNGQWDGSGDGFPIVEKPAKVELRSLKTSSKHQITVKWEGQEKAEGYQVKIATNSKFTKNVKTYYVTDATSKTIKNLTKGKKYYAKVRAYKYANGRYYGSWSSYKSIVCK